MITPYPPNEYPWAGGAIIAQLLDLAPGPAEVLREAALAVGVEALADPHLRHLCRCALSEQDPADAPLPELPDLPELADWCATHVAAGPRGIGLAIGAIAHAFGHRGWAVVAAAAAAGEAADRLPPFDALVAAVGRELDRELAVALEPLVIACPPMPAGLADLPPGHALVTDALGTLARAILDLEQPIAITATGALERAWVAALAAEPRSPFASRSSAPERVELAAAVGDLARTWTWSDFEAWHAGDPFVGPRAIARAHGLGVWLEAFDSIGAEIATALATELRGAWDAVRATAYAALPAPAADPLVVAIAALARSATAAAARLIAQRLAAGTPPDATFVAELLGDPRPRPALWHDAAPAIVAAMEERR